jgi:hypothetical protein
LLSISNWPVHSIIIQIRYFQRHKASYMIVSMYVKECTLRNQSANQVGCQNVTLLLRGRTQNCFRSGHKKFWQYNWVVQTTIVFFYWLFWLLSHLFYSFLITFIHLFISEFFLYCFCCCRFVCVVFFTSFYSFFFWLSIT